MPVLNTWVRWKRHQIFDEYKAIVLRYQIALTYTFMNKMINEDQGEEAAAGP